MAVRHFSSNGVDIAFLDGGEGEPILLIHGFASNHVVNWGATGWIDTLKRAGRRVIAMDVRGHGKSAKLYDPEAYRLDVMAEDAANLLDHLGSPAPTSWATRWARGSPWPWLLAHQDKVRSLILGGMGYAMVEGMRGEDDIVAALEAPSLDAVAGEPGRAYRKFAEQTGSDVRGAGRLHAAGATDLHARELATIHVPVLIAVGEKDRVAGSAEDLARLIPGAEVPDHSQARPHARDRRPSLQEGGARFPRAASVTAAPPQFRRR